MGPMGPHGPQGPKGQLGNAEKVMITGRLGAGKSKNPDLKGTYEHRQILTLNSDFESENQSAKL